MPFDEIQQKTNPNFILKECVADLERKLQHPVICYISSFCVPGKALAPEAVSITTLDMQGLQICLKDIRREELTLVLHTPGGDLEATKNIIMCLRCSFKKINLIVPHLAYSGGTMIACASDLIYMGPYSFLGPTDPQVSFGNLMVPVGAILKEFETAVQEIKADPARAQIWLRKLDQIPVGQIHVIMNLDKQAKEDTIKFLKKYHLHDQLNCNEKAKEIAEVLHGFEMHTSHGEGIGLEEAQRIGLKVKNLEDDKELEDKVLSVYHASNLLFMQTAVGKIIIGGNGKQFAVQQQVVVQQQR